MLKISLNVYCKGLDLHVQWGDLHPDKTVIGCSLIDLIYCLNLMLWVYIVLYKKKQLKTSAKFYQLLLDFI